MRHNNFYNQYAIFESTREAIAKNKELEFNSIALHTRGGCATSCFEAFVLEVNAYIAYCFNQSLDLSFLNDYFKEQFLKSHKDSNFL